MAILKQRLNELYAKVIEAYTSEAEPNYTKLANDFCLTIQTIEQIIEVHYKGHIRNAKTITLPSRANDEEFPFNLLTNHINFRRTTENEFKTLFTACR